MSFIKEVDHAAIRTGQLMVIVILLVAYIINSREMVSAIMLAFLLTTISTSIGPFALLYQFVLRPLNIVKPDIRLDNPEPHRFGQAVGIVVAALATYLLYTGNNEFGWGIVWLLIILTTISFAGWCAGCFTYYMINRLGVGGFFKNKPTDDSVFLGSRPKR